MPFDFEDFPVYKDAIQFADIINVFLEGIPEKGNSRLIDQLQRASTSIALNIAEGAGRYHKSDKRNYYVIARGSAYECVACLRMFLSRKLVPNEKHDEFYLALNNLAKQLSAMIKQSV